MNIDVLTIADFLNRNDAQRIIEEMRGVRGAAAGVSGTAKMVDPYVRQVLCAEVSRETIKLVTKFLLSIVPKLEDHFQVILTDIEEPQFLHYRPGDFFVAHQDGNTSLIADQTLARKVSVVIFLNEQCDDVAGGGYSGGSLLLHGSYPEWEYRQVGTSRPGTLIAFRSETTHEVEPVTSGERFTIVSWFRHELT